MELTFRHPTFATWIDFILEVEFQKSLLSRGVAFAVSLGLPVIV